MLRRDSAIVAFGLGLESRPTRYPSASQSAYRSGIQTHFSQKAISVVGGIDLNFNLRSIICEKAIVPVVWKRDRSSRSLKDLLNSIEIINDDGAGFRSLTEYRDATENGPGKGEQAKQKKSLQGITSSGLLQP
jgi:hypothetical protein